MQPELFDSSEPELVYKKTSTDRPTLYLIDGSAYIYRSYHAIRNLANSKGHPTNATFGFSRTILKMFDEKKPEFCVMLWDAKGPTFRHEMYDLYKANRKPMPDDLREQIPDIRAVTEAFGIPSVEIAGYEADDLAGTLARMGEEAGYDVVLVTGDKDFQQLVTDKTIIWDPVKEKVWTPLTVKEELGIRPDQVTQMMALTGDSSDNVPGVKGVGPKTAKTLVMEHGNLEAIYEALPGIKQKKLRENLENCRDDAFISRDLVTIAKDAPVTLTEADWKIGEPDRERLSELFREFGFRQLQQQFQPEKEDVEKAWSAIFEMTDLHAAVSEITKAGIVAFDTETTGLDTLTATLVGISLSWKKDQAVYIPIGHVAENFPAQLAMDDVLTALRPVFADAAITKIAQNLKYDWAILSRYDVELAGPLFDTLLASYVLEPTRSAHNLDALALDHFGHQTIKFSDVVTEKGKGFEAAAFDKAVDYACEDADITFALHGLLAPKIAEKGLTELFTTIEMPLVAVLMKMEQTGILADRKKLEALSLSMGEELESLSEEIFALAGEAFNINSPQQLGKILFEKLELPVQKKTRKKTGYSTDVSVLTALAELHELPKLILRNRTVSKLKSTYADALQNLIHEKTGRIHTSFNQGVTATGRLSSSDPNLQNIPVRTDEGREIRRAFIPEPGWMMMSADYSQIELRILAHCANDAILIEAFNTGEDIHTRTATEVFEVLPGFMTDELRRQAKAINFGIVYGMSAFRLSNELQISRKMAQTYIDNYFRRYGGVKDFIASTIDHAKDTGLTRTLSGRVRPVPEINAKNAVARQMAERIAVNTPIQGTAADLIKLAMIRVQEALDEKKMKTRMLLTVHDELVFEVPPEEKEAAEALVRKAMETVADLKVPLLVNLEWGENWSEAH